MTGGRDVPRELLIEIADDRSPVIVREAVAQEPSGEAGRPHDRLFCRLNDNPAHILV